MHEGTHGMQRGSSVKSDIVVGGNKHYSSLCHAPKTISRAKETSLFDREHPVPISVVHVEENFHQLNILLLSEDSIVRRLVWCEFETTISVSSLLFSTKSWMNTCGLQFHTEL